MDNVTHANNDNDTWTSIGFKTLLILNKLKLDLQLTEMANASGEVYGASLLGTRISPKIDAAAANRDACSEASALIDVVAISADIPSVQSSVGVSKIFEPVIITDAVDVIDFISRPSAVNPHPSKPMGLVRNAIDTNDDVSVPSFGTSDRAGFSAVIHRDQSGEQSCPLVVGQQVSEPFERQIGMEIVSHAILSKTSTEIEDLKKRNVSENDHGHGDPDAEHADEHERGKLANIR